MLFSIAALSNSTAQQAKSPEMTAEGKVGNASISIVYSSPSVRDREIWGALVPYDQVWRAGANKATTFETDNDIMVAGQKLAKGKYSIYMIPGEKEWQIIFNSEVGQWGIQRGGATTKKPENDVLTVKATPMSVDKQEALTYAVTADGFSLTWDKIKVSVPIK